MSDLVEVSVPVDLSEEEKFKILKSAVFTKCMSKDALQLWIATYLGIEIPDQIVDSDSNISPMQYLWDVYEAAQQSNPSFTRILAYASRDSYKTLITSILEVLVIVHLGRAAGHMGAVTRQAEQAQEYVENWLQLPWFSAYFTYNKTRKSFCRYEHKETFENITEKQYKKFNTEQRMKYKEYKAEVRIVVGTKKGANSLHVPVFVNDEVDLMDPAPYEESRGIPTSDKDPDTGKDRLPIVILTSTRKTAFGLVQKEITDSPRTGLRIVHWNALDITEPCPPERHLPHESQATVWVDNKGLRTYTEEEYLAIPQEKRGDLEQREAFSGCLKNCHRGFFAACKGRLATVQQPQKFGVRGLLKPLPLLIDKFRTSSPEYVEAQVLCRKPGSEGLIYPFLDPEVHLKTPAQMARMVIGETVEEEDGWASVRNKSAIPDDFTAEQLKQLFQDRKCEFILGMDFGFTHNFATVLGAVDAGRLFVVDAIAQAELMPSQQITLCAPRYARWRPKVYADTAAPQAIAEFRAAGFKMQEWAKKQVKDGIEIARRLIRPAVGDPSVYFLSGNPDVQYLFDQLAQYRWKLFPDGRASDIPNDKDDDSADAFRYLIQERFGTPQELDVGVRPARKDFKTARSDDIAEVRRRQMLEAAGLDPDNMALYDDDDDSNVLFGFGV